MNNCAMIMIGAWKDIYFIRKKQIWQPIDHMWETDKVTPQTIFGIDSVFRIFWFFLV